MAKALTKSPVPTTGNGIKPALRGKNAVLPAIAKAKRATGKASAPSNGAGGKLRGTARLFRIIEHLAARPGRIVDVTRELGLPWATVHRSVAQLAKANFLRRDPETHRYEIGPSLWYAGTSYVANHRVLRAAMPYLHKAEQIHGIAVQLTERIGYQAVNIYSAQPYATDISKAQYGYHFPLHCGSKGKVLLAFSDPAFVEEYLRRPLEKLTDFSVTDPATLRKELNDVRRRGYSVTIGDVQPFTGSIAAPVRDSSARVVAAICFLARKTLIQNEKRCEELLEHLQHAAHSASIDLGWRPDPAERHTPLIQRRS